MAKLAIFKNSVLALEEANFFSSHNQVMRRGEFFKMVRFKIEKQVSEVRTKVKN